MGRDITKLDSNTRGFGMTVQQEKHMQCIEKIAQIDFNDTEDWGIRPMKQIGSLISSQCMSVY